MEDSWMWDNIPLVVCTWKEILCICVIQLKQDKDISNDISYHIYKHSFLFLTLLHQQHSYMTVEGTDHFQFPTSVTPNIWMPCCICLLSPYILVRCKSTVSYICMLLFILVQMYQHHRNTQCNTALIMITSIIKCWMTLKRVNRCYQMCIKVLQVWWWTKNLHISVRSCRLRNIKIVFTAEFVDSRTPVSLCTYDVIY